MGEDTGQDVRERGWSGWENTGEQMAIKKKTARRRHVERYCTFVC